MFNRVFDSVMRRSALIFCAAEIVLGGLIFLEVSKYGALNIAVGMISSVLAVIFVIYLIRSMSGDSIASKNNEAVERNLGIWGYLWRAIVVKYFSLFAFAIFITLIKMITSYSLPDQSIVYTVVFSFLMLPVYVFSTWLFFSSNRKGQVQWVATIFRGY